MISITSNTRARSTQGSSSDHHFRQQTEELAPPLRQAAQEHHPLSLDEPPRALETEGVSSAQNEGSTSLNTAQIIDNSNRISLQEELQEELSSSILKFLFIKIRLNNSSSLKKKVLTKKKKQNLTKFQHIQEKFGEAWSKLYDLSSENQRVESDLKGRVYSKKEEFKKLELQSKTESSKDLKGKGKEKISVEEELEELEQKVDSAIELEKESKKELEEFKQQLIGLKNARRNVIKFLKVIEADLKGVDLYYYSWLKWISALTPPIINLPLTAANIALRTPFIGWCIALGTNLITWGINDIFNPILRSLNQYRTEDLTFLKEEVFTAALLSALEDRISDFEEGIVDFEKEISDFDQGIKDMSNLLIVKTQRELIRSQQALINAQQASAETQQALLKASAKTQQDLREAQKGLAEKEAKHEKGTSELKVQLTLMEAKMDDKFNQILEKLG